jgi:hypothetical protein
MPISFKHKLIFVHIPKNAGTTITNALNMSDIGHHLPIYYKRKYPKEWETFKKFAVYRNPWDRVVSNYEYARLKKSYWHSSQDNSKHVDYDLLKNLSFDECINILVNSPGRLKHQGWGSQNQYLKIDNVFLNDIFLIKIENLKDEIFNKLSIDINIPNINSSEHSNYISYYDNKKNIEIINNIYNEDITKFNYKFNND